MPGHCYVCTRAMTAADGPGLLWTLAGVGQPRQPFHLTCWLRWRTTPRSGSLPEADRPRRPHHAQRPRRLVGVG